jgi:hypothetical protein
MASYIKEKLTGAQSNVDSGNADKYFIQVSASPSYNHTHAKQVVINGPACSVSKNLSVAVRIKEYQGLPTNSPPTSPYFTDSAHTKDTYSIAVSWIPEADITANDLVWGIELVNPIRDHIPKRFITTAFEIVKGFVDPSLKCDPYADQPWLNGPILCSTAITFSIGPQKPTSCVLPPILAEGSIPDDAPIRSTLNIPTTESQRRKHFADEQNRKAFVFEKGRCYAFDFHNGYIDWKNYALKLPGFSFGVLKYINDRTHTTRFVLKSRESGEVFAATTFKLLYGEELEKAKKGKSSSSSSHVEDEQEKSSQQQHDQAAETLQKGPLHQNANNPESSNDEQQHQSQLQEPKPVNAHTQLPPLQGPVQANGEPIEACDKSNDIHGDSSLNVGGEEEQSASAAAAKVIAESEARRN